MITSQTKWIYKNVLKENEELEKNINININSLIKKLLISRGYDTDEKINDFLYSDATKLYDPYLIKDMDRAVNRILKALDNKEKVIIYGDYDVDGISSTTLLFSYFKKIGLDVSYYIPNRISDGYGLNKEVIKKFADEKYNLVVTCDTGITAIEEAEYIRELGMELLVTDHHEMQDNKIPNCTAVVDLKRGEDNYEFRELAGCGIAFKFICAINIELLRNEKYKDKYEKLNIEINDYLELACLGTISDVVPLVSENRIIVKEGIKRLYITKRIGLKLLLEKTLIDANKITSTDIAFYLVPKLNAAGRISDASIGVSLLMCDDEEEASNMIKELLKLNDLRKKTEDNIFGEAVNIIETNEEYKNEKILLLKNKNWHHGVIGIVAAKIADMYHKPVVMLCEEDGMLQGSARKVGSVNIFDILEKGKKYLTKFGGHEGAAGITLDLENFDSFKNEVVKYADEIITEDLLMPTCDIDIECDINDVTLETANELSMLEPFGEANQKPVFKISTEITNASLMGKTNDHLKLKIKSLLNSYDCVGFGRADLFEKIVYNKTYDIAATLDINEFMGQRKLQFMLKDIKSSNVDEMIYHYEKMLFSKVTHKDINEILENDIEIINDDNNNDFVYSVDNFMDLLDKTVNDYEYMNVSNLDSETLKNNIKIYVTNDKDVLNKALDLYDNDIKVFYGNIDFETIKNAIFIEKKKAIILALNIMKLIDLRKKYSIIYSDNVDNYANKHSYLSKNVSISKEEVASVYKRLMYLKKINKYEIFLEDLLFNLKELDIYKILISLEILKELGIINYNINSEDIIEFSINEDVKNAIENSELFIRLKN